MVCSCQQQFAFSERQKHLFDLVRKDSVNGEAAILIKGLPAVDPVSLVVEQDQDDTVERMYCPIYVYL